MYSVDLETASGHALDAIALSFGLVRIFGEPDSTLRERYKEFNQILPESKAPVCECGAHKIGYTEPGLGHSHWCPLS